MTTPPSFTAYTPLAASSLNAVGLWKVASSSVNGLSVSFNNVFTSDYENYKVIITLTSGTAADFNLRLRRSGADETGAVYAYSRKYDYTSAPNGLYQAQGSLTTFGYAGTNFVYGSGTTIDFYAPQLAAITHYYSESVGAQNAAPYLQANETAGAFISYNQCDGFTIYSTNTMVGNVYVYGLRK